VTGIDGVLAHANAPALELLYESEQPSARRVIACQGTFSIVAKKVNPRLVERNLSVHFCRLKMNSQGMHVEASAPNSSLVRGLEIVGCALRGCAVWDEAIGSIPRLGNRATRLALKVPEAFLPRSAARVHSGHCLPTDQI
jgi:hypothetical protein